MEVGIKEMKKKKKCGQERQNSDKELGWEQDMWHEHRVEHHHLQNTQTQNLRSAQTITSALKHLYDLEVQHPTLQTGSREWQPPAILLAHLKEMQRFEPPRWATQMPASFYLTILENSDCISD